MLVVGVTSEVQENKKAGSEAQFAPDFVRTPARGFCVRDPGN